MWEGVVVEIDQALALDVLLLLEVQYQRCQNVTCRMIKVMTIQFSL